MPRPSVAIVGLGAVGNGMRAIFPDAACYDPALGFEDRAAIERADITFICVPTPANPDGSCDTSTVEQTLAWLGDGVIVIRSTVPPGTTARLVAATGKRIVFQPEYGPGGTPDHPFADVRAIDWVILGGARADTVAVADLYKTVFNSSLAIHQTDATTAELTKYMENAFLAMKVAFCNELYDLAAKLNVDYNELRELWLLDPRIGRSHTWVHPDDRGFGGDCLPKDLSALLHLAASLGDPPPLLTAIHQSNANHREPAK